MRNTKLFKIIMTFVLLCSASAAAGSTASAWTTNAAASGSPFTATAPAALLRISPPGAATVGLNCTGTVAPGNRALGTLVALTGSPGTPKLLVSNLKLEWTNCTIAGVPATVTCTNSAQLWANGPATVGVSGTVNGEVRNLNCTVTAPAFSGCTVTIVGGGASGRAVFSDYSNAASTLTALLSPAQTLQATWSSSCTFLPAPTPPETIGGPAPATITNKGLTALVHRVTSAFKPVITDP
jgi:hypothetical protein